MTSKVGRKSVLLQFQTVQKSIPSKWTGMTIVQNTFSRWHSDPWNPRRVECQLHCIWPINKCK